uniref:Centromere protein P n=1 Tax=Eptatretus burgeri TaxID=7764 RepID=A0A8C4R5N4_EPTBU
MEVNLLSVAEKKMTDLRDEITMLEQKLKEKEKEVQNFQKNRLHQMRTLLCKPQGTPPDLEVMEDKFNTMQLLRKMHEQMTGFRLWNFIPGQTNQGPQGKTQSCRFTGEGFSVCFQMELVIAEPPAENPTANHIKHLEIVLERPVSSDLTSLSSRAEETCDLMLFFRTLRQFGCWAKHRRATFCHLQAPAAYSLENQCHS